MVYPVNILNLRTRPSRDVDDSVVVWLSCINPEIMCPLVRRRAEVFS